ARGEYTYTLRYRTNRQLYFGSDHDELYWNVTGNGWEFRIDSASARVTLPQPVPATRLRAFGFTGAQGSLEAALEASTIDGGGRWQSTSGLAPQEGMSLVLEFPKGIVAEPDAREKIGWLLHDNRHLLAMLVGLALLWAWYGWMWHRHGRDPARGVRMPLYEPPNGYSPASLRFVREMGYDDECLAAALISLASKGALQIHEDEKHTITLRKDSGGSRLRSEEHTSELQSR